MKKWFLLNKKSNYDKLRGYRDLTDIQRVIIANRDLVKKNEIESIIDPSIKKMHDPFLLHNMAEAIELIVETIMVEGKITIVGDYDQDGVAATVILMKGIGYFHDNIEYSIPDRVEDGYGLNKNIVDKAIAGGSNLIITCDNGIAAFEAIEYARQNKINVIVTDHHQVVIENGKEKLPKANAIINPVQKNCSYPFKQLSGAAVAYKLVDALYNYLAEELGVNNKEIVYDLLQYAALGTVADIMDLIEENRIIVVEGLKRLNNTSNVGLKNLYKQVKLTREVDVYVIGFIIAPIINATGRLSTAKLGVRLLLENDENQASILANKLVELNNKRKSMTLDSVEMALEQVNKEKLYNDDIIVIYNEKIHESICGLVAGRIKENYHKPVIVLTKSDENNILKGSGRSIESYDMYKNLSDFSYMYTSFGGHKMACGLSMLEDNLEKFIKKINGSSNLMEDDFLPKVDIDAPLELSQITEALIDNINQLEPFGKGFSKPKFASKNLVIKNIQILGAKKNLLKFKFEENGIQKDAISFEVDKVISYLEMKFYLKDLKNNPHLLINKKVDLVYSPQINEFRGYKNIQLVINDIR